MSDEKCNGWANYETWVVKLWMDNDEGSYNYWTEIAQDCYDHAEKDDTLTREENAALALRDILKDEYEENSPAGVTGVYADLMNHALARIDWYEIATALIDDEVDKDNEENAGGGSDAL